MEKSVNNLVLCERNSPSDDVLICLRVSKQNGDWISCGEIIFEIEGAKAVFEVQANHEGYFYSRIKEGQRIKVGEVLAQISEKEIDPKELELWIEGSVNVFDTSQHENMTQSAQEFFQTLPEKQKVIISDRLDEKRTYTKKDLQGILDIIGELKAGNRINIEAWSDQIKDRSGKTEMFFIGGGYGAVQALDLLLFSNEFYLKGFTSDFDSNVLDQLDIPKMGDCSDVSLENLAKKNPGAAFAITAGTSPEFRLKVYSILVHLNVSLPNLMHPSVTVSRNSSIGRGNLIFANVFIGVDSRIGNANFISSNSIIEHHNYWGDGNCVGPSLSTSGLVSVGDGCKFGSGVVVEPQIDIGSKSVIASNITVTSNVMPREVRKGRM